MPDASKIINDRKVMWDGVEYETEKEAQDVKKTYEDGNFEVELVEEEGKYLLYTRRVVTEIVLEGEAPP
ncbi:MAG: hypothetical protein PVI66_04615 [Candidatus Aminicenantes bacterium]|jgi:hypothetical protein